VGQDGAPAAQRGRTVLTLASARRRPVGARKRLLFGCGAVLLQCDAYGLGQGRATSAAGHPFARRVRAFQRYDEATRGVNQVGDHAAEAGVRQRSGRARVASGVLTPRSARESVRGCVRRAARSRPG
jgi:hypothetical protein